MIPNIKILTNEITEIDYGNKTYKIEATGDRINGYVDEIDAIKQSIYCILSTERYKHLIYSWDYGVELVDLIGKPIPYCMAVIPRRIREALLTDDRILSVTDFEFEHKGNKLHTTFIVTTNVGHIESELEVEV